MAALSRKLPDARIGHVSAICDSYLLAWGGYNGEHNDRYLPGRELLAYNLEQDSWHISNTCGDFPTGTSGATAQIIQEHMYIFAGHTYHGNTNELYRLNLQTLEWTLLKPSGPRPSPRDKLASWCYRSKLYIFGGFGPPPDQHAKLMMEDPGLFIADPQAYTIEVARGWNNDLVIYDIETNAWCTARFKGERPSPRAAHASAIIGSRVYIFGGRLDTKRMNDLHCLDLNAQAWSGSLMSHTDVPCGRSWHSFTAITEQKIFLFGGYSQNNEPLNDSWLLDTATLEWSILPLHRSPPRLWHAAVSTGNGDVYIYGGCGSDILDEYSDKIICDDLLVFNISPKSLLRLCLDVVYKYKTRTENDWAMLPGTLRLWLMRKSTSLEYSKQEEDSEVTSDKSHHIGATCALQ